MSLFGLTLAETLGIYGAALSTCLAFGKLLHPRPIARLEMSLPEWTFEPELKVTIVNPAKHPILVTNVTSRGTRTLARIGSVADWELRDIVRSAMNNKLNVMVPPEQTLRLNLVLEELPEKALWLFVWYRSHRLIDWPMFPTIFRRSKRAIEAMREHPAKGKG